MSNTPGIPVECKVLAAIKPVQEFALGTSILISGLPGTEYNLLAQDMFKEAVRRTTDDDEEITLIYYTRSALVRAELMRHIARTAAPGVTAIVRQYYRLDVDSVFEDMADEEVGDLRFVFIEDLLPTRTLNADVRRLRVTAADTYIFVATAAMNELALDVKQNEIDAEDFLGDVMGKGYEVNRRITTEFDIAIIADGEPTYLGDDNFEQWTIVDKFRGEDMKNVGQRIHHKYPIGD